MTLLEAMEARHAVRSYLSKPIPENVIAALQQEIDACNDEAGLHIQLVTNEPKAFSTLLARYGKFKNVQNYIALIGKKSDDLDGRIGYYGEHIALHAQMLGLNTCWVAVNVGKNAVKAHCTLAPGEKLVCVLALGYGATQGKLHTNRDPYAVSDGGLVDTPEWYKRGIHYALLAPTAMNQQKFLFFLKDNVVTLHHTGGFYPEINKGILKYHFEHAAGKENFRWGE